MFSRLLAGMLCLVPTISFADQFQSAAGSYRVGGNSTIQFNVAQLGGDPVEGTFARFGGVFRLDPDIDKSHVEISLEPASVKAADPRIEDFIRSPAVFDADRHKQVRFVSTHVRRTGENGADIEGRLTAKGITHSARFHVDFEGMKGKSIRFHATGKLSRDQFDMGIGTPIYSNWVLLDMHLVADRQ